MWNPEVIGSGVDSRNYLDKVISRFKYALELYLAVLEDKLEQEGLESESEKEKDQEQEQKQE